MTVLKRNSILVFDTNIFLTGIDFSIIPYEIYSTNQAIEEIEVLKYEDKNRTIVNRIYAAKETGQLKIKTPIAKYLNSVIEKSKLTGDFSKLSETDIGVIALALELRDTRESEVIIYTNDYSMENLCSHLGLKFKSIFKPGIKKNLIFEMYCPICNKVYPSNIAFKICDNCGINLKRRAIYFK
jgi:UPF0271 protein